MSCKACKFDHPAMQDCKVAARIRAANDRVEAVEYIEKKRNDATVKVKNSVTKADSVTATPTPSVTKADSVTTVPKSSVTEFEHPNVYPNPSELGWDKLEWPKLPKTAAERMREMRSRKPKTAAQWVESLVHKPV